MQYTFLGKTGMKVSRLCLGTMNFACQTSEQDCFRMMDEALDMGINFFDTADAYGAGLEDRGGAEKIIGRWLAQGRGRRDAVIIAAKGPPRNLPDASHRPQLQPSGNVGSNGHPAKTGKDRLRRLQQLRRVGHCRMLHDR